MATAAIVGATGRMGAALRALSGSPAPLQIAAALTRSGHPLVGQPWGDTGLTVTDDLRAGLAGVDVAIDFARADQVGERAQAVAEAGCAWLLGSTGLSAEDDRAIEQAARRVAVLHTANSSLAVNACFAAAAQLARLLGRDYDVDIVELHHSGKRDAPSGTALEFARVLADARGSALDDLLWRCDPADDRVRPPGRIAITSVRAAGHAGEHRILFSSEDDTVTLTHVARSRAGFARGALALAAWLAEQPPGRYLMSDFLAARRRA